MKTLSSPSWTSVSPAELDFETGAPWVHLLAHLLKTRAIAEARIKTDTIDATILVHLVKTGLLPTS